MFGFKKRRLAAEAARQEVLRVETDELGRALVQKLSIPDLSERQAALQQFRDNLDRVKETALLEAQQEKNRTCFWVSIGAFSPLPLLWLAVEPVSGTVNLVGALLASCCSPLFLSPVLEKTGLGDGAIKTVQPFMEVLEKYAVAADEALQGMGQKGLSSPADASPLRPFRPHVQIALRPDFMGAGAPVARTAVPADKPAPAKFAAP